MSLIIDSKPSITSDKKMVVLKSFPFENFFWLHDIFSACRDNTCCMKMFKNLLIITYSVLNFFFADHKVQTFKGIMTLITLYSFS